ncbi:hypothetical protein DN730_14025 [Marinomonas piezotolerans]|uniref:Response regulatory domain-containing protein n=1 Tax=Marinomonas piezotolerans TaxID=2213058 RepID=A0A370U6R3_9GAMM|nr:fused response regulator/phosphatase [Marinomonas piezotolerans]RDL43451.1 hypothetical protein DN730_14025 [Marinomonas piezotolerans]
MSKTPRVLLLEDNSTTRLLISAAMQAHGVEVVETTTVKDVYAHLDDDSIDLYLMDINLPDGMSSELLPQLTERHPLTPVVMMTADTDYSEVGRFFKSGAKDFINKPINPVLLMAKVLSFLQNAEDKKALLKANETYQRITVEKAQEEELAFHVYDYILKTHATKTEGINVANRSSAQFCGDILLSTKAPNGNLIVMLADATGHGMAAALTIYPLVSTFTAMVSKGLSLGAIILELSEKHSQSIPHNRFVASIFIEISPSENTLKFWNGGMPKILAFDEDHRLIDKIPSKNMAIGILPTDMVNTKMETYDLQAISHLCFFSDGLIENKILDGKHLSFDDCYALIAEKFDAPNDVVQKMLALENLDASGESNIDDMTICHIDIGSAVAALRNESLEKNLIPGKFEFAFEVNGAALLNERLPFSLSEMLASYEFVKEFCQRVFTVVTELFTNSVDHGVLGIDSGLKENNFLEYISARMHATEELNTDDFVKVVLRWEAETRLLHITVSDSGQGYQLRTEANDQGLDKAYGRGLKLVTSFAQTFEYDPQTNSTHVALHY